MAHGCATRLCLLRYLPSLHKWSRVTIAGYGTRFQAPLLGLFGDGEMAQLSALALVFTLAWFSKRNAGYPIGGFQAVIGRIADRLVLLRRVPKQFVFHVVDVRMDIQAFAFLILDTHPPRAGHVGYRNPEAIVVEQPAPPPHRHVDAALRQPHLRSVQQRNEAARESVCIGCDANTRPARALTTAASAWRGAMV